MKLERDDFAKFEGTIFRAVIIEGESTEMKLVNVGELTETDRTESFSLVFEVPAEVVVVTGMVRVEHDELGSFDLGISPFDQDERVTRYEAVFNRLKTDSGEATGEGAGETPSNSK